MPATQEETSIQLEAHRKQVRLHCYRMTGCLQDADDLTQETLLKAWQNLPSFRGESLLATWIYRIATNVCLDFLRGKKNRVLPWGPDFPQYKNGADLPPPLPEALWLEPYPDPEDLALRREHVSLAFLTLLQTLPPKQRAAVILTDVLGYSAKESADLLELTVASVNSALQRARKTLEPSRLPQPDPQEKQELVERFLRAWEAGDAAGIVKLMREDTRMVMPPIPLWVQGPADILQVLLDFPFRRGEPNRWKLVQVKGANGEPAAGFYERDTVAGVYKPWGIQVLVLGASRGGSQVIAEYHVFKGAHLVEAFGLPPTWPLNDEGGF